MDVYAGAVTSVGLNAGFRASFGSDPAVFGTDANGVPQLEHGIFEYGQLVTAGLGLSLRVVDPLTLQPPADVHTGAQGLAAVWFGDVRLIDNMRLV